MDKEINNKLENIEDLLKMLLVNSLLEDSETERIMGNALQDINKVLEPIGFYNIRLNNIENQYYVFAELREKCSAQSIIKMYQTVLSALDGIKLVIVFDKLHSNTKKSLENNKVSIYERNREMHIY